jgi:ParB family chromosome partitioning protein
MSLSFKQQQDANRAESIARKTDAPTSAADAKIRARNEGTKQLAGATRIEVDRIVRDANQPREEFDESALEDLAESFRSRGQLQPIRVRWDDEVERYIVVLGERRWRAAQIAGLKHLDCVVVIGNPTADDLLEDQIIENALRKDLKPVEQGKAYKRLMESRGWTMRDLADRLHISPASVSNACLMAGLPPEAQELVDDGKIPAKTGILIASKIEDPAEQVALARRFAEEQPSREDTEAAVHRAVESKPKVAKPRDTPKGRGAKPKPKPALYPTGEWSDDSPTIKITATGKRRRKFDGAELLTALEKATARVRAEIAAEQGGDSAAA